MCSIFDSLGGFGSGGGGGGASTLTRGGGGGGGGGGVAHIGMWVGAGSRFTYGFGSVFSTLIYFFSTLTSGFGYIFGSGLDTS